MLGKHVGSMSGTTSNKALPSNGGGMPRMETRATTQGKLAGEDLRECFNHGNLGEIFSCTSEKTIG